MKHSSDCEPKETHVAKMSPTRGTLSERDNGKHENKRQNGYSDKDAMGTLAGKLIFSIQVIALAAENSGREGEDDEDDELLLGC